MSDQVAPKVSVLLGPFVKNGSPKGVPFEALFWSPEFEFSEPKLADLLHDKGQLSKWMETVPEFEEYEDGSEAKQLKVPR